MVQIIEESDSVTYSPEVLSPVINKVEGSTVIVQDCVVDDTYLQNRTTGEIVDEGLRTRQVTVELVYLEGRWQVRESNINHKYEGESSCPERA